MEAAEKEGELYLSAVAAALYEQLGGKFIITTGTHKMSVPDPIAIIPLTELLIFFDLDWWIQLQSKFEVTK
jgi:hypothetical protein